MSKPIEQLLTDIKNLLAPNDICVGYETLPVLAGSVAILASIPANATSMIFQVETTAAGKAVRFREDGGDPTSSIGKYKQAGDEYQVIGAQSLKQFKATQGDTGTTQLNIFYYR